MVSLEEGALLTGRRHKGAFLAPLETLCISGNCISTEGVAEEWSSYVGALCSKLSLNINKKRELKCGTHQSLELPSLERQSPAAFR